MATKRSGSAKASTKSAGKPKTDAPARKRAARAGARAGPGAGTGVPSAEELDLRDRLKSGPRRPAGPPLVGDVPTRSAMEALRTEHLPAPTVPKLRRARS